MDSLPQDHAPVIELVEADIPCSRSPDTASLAGLTWTVRAGDFWVLGGLQGCGKSDLLLTAAALLRPLRGACRLFGQEITPGYTDERLAERVRVGLVFGEGGRLLRRLTVRENVALPLLYHTRLAPEEVTSRVDALLQAAGVAEQANRPISALNPAWQLRVGLARALALTPEVLMLDNPLAGLDPRHARWWLNFLGRLSAGHPLQGGGPTTLVVTTDDLRPWVKPGRKFALLVDNSLVPVEDPRAPASHTTFPVLLELLSDLPSPT